MQGITNCCSVWWQLVIFRGCANNWVLSHVLWKQKRWLWRTVCVCDCIFCAMRNRFNLSERRNSEKTNTCCIAFFVHCLFLPLTLVVWFFCVFFFWSSLRVRNTRCCCCCRRRRLFWNSETLVLLFFFSWRESLAEKCWLLLDALYPPTCSCNYALAHNGDGRQWWWPPMITTLITIWFHWIAHTIRRAESNSAIVAGIIRWIASEWFIHFLHILVLSLCSLQLFFFILCWLLWVNASLNLFAE